MIGLRNFINDFSLLNEKQIEEIKLWNYYIIYAVLFNEKGNLNDDSYLFFEKYISSYIKQYYDTIDLSFYYNLFYKG